MRKISFAYSATVFTFTLIMSGCSRLEQNKLEVSTADRSADVRTKSKTPLDPLAARLIEVTKSSLTSKNESVALSQELNTPQTILLNATNFETMMRPIFGNHGRISASDNNYFTAADKIRMGDYVMLGATNRMAGPISISQDYIFTLRTFAGRACKSLVETEIRELATSSNILVKKYDYDSGKLLLETINNFMSKVFDYSPPGGGIHPGAEEYQTLFNQAVAASENPGESRARATILSDNYKLLCVYIVTDPRSYSR